MARVELVVLGDKSFEVFLGVEIDFWEDCMAVWPADTDVNAEYTDKDVAASGVAMDRWLANFRLVDGARRVLSLRRVEIAHEAD